MDRKKNVDKIPSNSPKLSYVTEGALLKCNCGAAPVELKVVDPKRPYIRDKRQATVMDYQPQVNIPSFGHCKSNNGPCNPAIFMQWINGKEDTKINDAPALTESSTLSCINGGLIRIQDDGQITRSMDTARMNLGGQKIANGGLMMLMGYGAWCAGFAIGAAAAAPVVVAAAIVAAAGAACFIMGGSDIIEGGQDVAFGAAGSDIQSKNGVRDTIFLGDSQTYNNAEMIATTVCAVGDAALLPLSLMTASGKVGNQLALEGAGAGRVNANPSGKSVTSSMRLQAEKVDVVEETKLAENAVVRAEIDEEQLFARTSFRKKTREKALNEAPKNANGQMICTTCGNVIPDKITKQTKNGPVERVGYDLDHYPTTWEERIQDFKQQETLPARKEVRNAFNRDLRVLCPDCNQSHRFEGIEGTYKGVNNGE